MSPFAAASRPPITHEPEPHALDQDLWHYLTGSTNAHLPKCPECQARLVELVRSKFSPENTSPPAESEERRREHRIEIYDATELRMLNPFSPRIVEAMAVNISPGGAQFRTPVAMPVDGLVQIRISGKSTVMIGQIRHCTPRDGANYVGVEIRLGIPSH